MAGQQPVTVMPGLRRRLKQAGVRLLVLDHQVADGSVFTGDLTAPALAGEDRAEVIAASGRRLRQLGATRVYPGHRAAADLTR